MRKKEGSANLPHASHFVLESEKLHALYKKSFSARDDKTLWLFRGERRRKNARRNSISASELARLVECQDRKCNEIFGVTEHSYFQTSLDKAFVSFEPDKVEKGRRYTRQDLENALIREFQRKAHHHLQYVPDIDNTLEWLTLMQHYEGPTRLLDWTYSFYVALFFALAKLDCKNEYAEVWVVNSRWITKAEKRVCTSKNLMELSKLRKKDPVNMDKYHNAILNRTFERPRDLVLVLNSFRLNERLIVQQGTFLVQGNICVSFDDNLRGMASRSTLKKSLHRIVIDLEVAERNRILSDINKMNINNATLFPGLQGFAESLATQLGYPEKFGLNKKKLKN